MHDNFISLKIDDNKEIFDLSDHNLLTATFYKNNGHQKKFAKKKCKEITYMKITDDSKKNFIGNIHQNMNKRFSTTGDFQQQKNMRL